MTKSGIGTESMVNPMIGHNHHHHNLQQQNASTSSIVISKTEIPIWVSDRKKWVTGINKRTTVNDLIFAVLKQCQVISGGQLVGVKHQIGQSKTSLESSQATLMEQISNLFVLVEYYFELDSSIDTSLSSHQHHGGQCTSQRLLENDSKVYKYFNKWLQSPNSYMLKILQRQIPLNEQIATSIEATNHTEQVNSMNNSGSGGHSSLATKLLRKFGVSSTTGSSVPPTSNTASIATSNGVATSQTSHHIPPPHLTSSVRSSSSSYRFVDVQLPVQTQPTSRSKSNQQQCTQQQQQQNHSPTASNSTTSSNNTASSNNTSSSDKQARNNQSFDPAAQKVFLYNSIVDKENKLRQQRERFKLIDELLKETEKKSSKYMSSNTPDSMLYDSSVKPLNLLAQLKHAHIDLADIYSNFPEMRTNNLEDVEEFSQVCNRLFQLDEDIKEQKEMLNKLESELQRELNTSHLPNNNFSNGGACAGVTSLAGGASGGDSVETMQLRKEVSLSREQTRIQCKQLHDLDAKMRLNEQSLALKEQQLQKLLEELYIEEMYADSALENEMTTHNESSASFGQNGRRSRQQVDNEPNMDYYYEQDASRNNNNQSDDHLIINDELLMNSDRVELSGNHVEFDDDTLPIHHHHNIDYIDHHLNQMLLNAANAKQIELKINNEVAKYNGGPNGHNIQSNGGGSIRIAGSNQFMNGLTPSQKSLSYGNLLHGNESNSIKINNLVSPNTANQQQPTTGQKLNSIKAYKSNTTMNNGVKPAGMKTSPSLDLNKAQQQHNNGGKKGVDQSGNTGDNDSGISSVSSEATTTITTNHTTMLTTTSSSSSCQNIAGSNQITSIPINMMNQYQRQQYFQQQQIQRQYQAKIQQQSVQPQPSMAVQAASSSTKPVLETLV